MKAVILAGGLGTRLSEETHLKPKPMVEIGGMPILWHIMKGYSSHGIHDFIICCGYKGVYIKEFFSNYFLHTSDVEIDVRSNKTAILNKHSEPWKITLVDTGVSSMTGGRLKRISKYIENEDCFCFTYGDGLSDINFTEEIEFHRSHGRLATVCSVQAPTRFGLLEENGDMVTSFNEKPRSGSDRINGGFFVLNPKVLDFINGDNDVWEGKPLEDLAQSGELMSFKHNGFWQPMDTLREKNLLEEMWLKDNAPWKNW